MEEARHGTPYVLGHSAHELERLSAQALLYDPLTLEFLRSAGIEAGMRVLDVGCGRGDVSFLVSRLVGSSGLRSGASSSNSLRTRLPCSDGSRPASGPAG